MPLGLTVEQAKRVKARARSHFDIALRSITGDNKRDGFEELEGAELASVRIELAWSFYRIAMQELDGIPPPDQILVMGDNYLASDGDGNVFSCCSCEPRCSPAAPDIAEGPCTEPK